MFFFIINLCIISIIFQVFNTFVCDQSIEWHRDFPYKAVPEVPAAKAIALCRTKAVSSAGFVALYRYSTIGAVQRRSHREPFDKSNKICIMRFGAKMSAINLHNTTLWYCVCVRVCHKTNFHLFVLRLGLLLLWDVKACRSEVEQRSWNNNVYDKFREAWLPSKVSELNLSGICQY